MLMWNCSRLTPFTYEIKTNIELEGVKLSKIQFYTEKQIVLNLNESKSDRRVSDGTITQKSKITKNYITFKAKLMGVYQKQSSNTIYVCFDKYKPALSLPFVLNQGGFYTIGNNQDLFVEHDSKMHYIKEGKGSTIMVSAKIRNRFKTKTSKAKGFRITQ